MSKSYDIDIRLNMIRAWMHYNGVTPHRIATAMGLSPGALRDVFKPDWNPKTSTLRAIEQFMEEFRAERAASALTGGPVPGTARRSPEGTSSGPLHAGRPETRRS